METQTLLNLLFGSGLVLLGAYTLYHEKDLIRLERKAGRYIKAFFKALIYTLKERSAKNESGYNKYPT